MAGDFAHTWSKIRGARVQVDEGHLQIVPKGNPTVHKQYGNRILEERINPTQLSRAADLTDEDIAEFEATILARETKMADIESFASRKAKSEGME